MKCVGLLVFVLLVQSVDQFLRVKNRKWNSEPIPSFKVPDISKKVNSSADKAATLDIFRSTMNKTHGFVIPNELVLQVPLSDVSDVSANLLTSFRIFQQTLTDLSDCKSKSVSSVATDLIKLIGRLTKSIGSLTTDRVSLSNGISESFRDIIDAIAILDMGTGTSDAIEKIKESLLDVIRVLDENKSTDITKKLNDAVFSLTLSVQVLIVTTGIIAESGAKQLATITAEVKEAVVSLTLILHAIIVVVQNAISSITSSVLSSPNNPSEASVLNSFVVIIDRVLPEMTNVLATITSSSIISSSSLIVSTISLTLNSVITRLSESIGKLQTSVVLEVPNTLENLLFNLIGSEADFVNYVTTSTATIASSIVAISSSDGGVHSKIARHLYPVYQSLLQLGPNEHDIASNVTNLLPSILDVLKAAASHLLYSIGPELTNAITTYIEEIFTALQKMTKMLGQADINDEAMDEYAIECAKSVQIFGSVVVTFSHAIFISIHSTNAVAHETVIALPILHSTVLYAVEWVTVVASSILSTKGNKSEILPSLAVTIVAILKHDAKIVEMIAAAATRNVSDILTFIDSTVGELTHTNSQLTSISGITAKSSIEIQQISNGITDVAVEGTIKTTPGDLSQFLSGLTGSLSQISSFSSSLNGLKNTFKQIASSESGILQSLSVVLDSIATDLTDISGSATQILHSTSTLLHSIFGRLVESTSRLSQLKDLVTPLCTSIANISTALHSLIHAIRNYKLSSSFIIDSIRELAKTVQIIISTFSDIITSAANVDSAVLDMVSVEIAVLPYLLSTVILCVQQVIGAAILTVSEASGTISAVQHDFTVAVSSILENLTSIAAETTTFVTDGTLKSIPSNILRSVSSVDGYASASLSKISGVTTNIQVTLANKTS